MRKQVICLTMNTITTDEVSCERFYGVIRNGVKHFVTRRSEYHDGNFVLRRPEHLTKNLGHPELSSWDLSSLLVMCISDGDKVSQFDSYRELFMWLLE